ncbi:MAG: carboxypeptidase regulatory-like domain-containing protein, partial [Pyrinomonadaceae bacterium]|nr:carboxypeptidase regulatory-like domain-containing protein [Pyrinomonadaceae bacterium]
MAQSATGRITGTVQDPSGAVVPGAAVTATNEETNVSYNTISSDAGEYRFEALQPGPYTITVEQANFKRYSTTKNVLTANDTATIDIPLEIGNVSETVEVSGTYERVQTDQSGNTGSIVNERSLRDLPIVGRNPLSLIAYQPGVTQGSNTTGNTHIFGSRDRAFNITLDGIDANETSAGSATFSPIRTNPDSLREYRVITSNPSAEFGRNSGAQIALVTMSGTNEFHGNLFEFHRNRVLNANEWELNRVGTPRRFFLRNQFGGSIGGPIIKDKTFFFFNTQFQRQTRTLEQINTVYTAEARRGNFRYALGQRNQPFGVTGASVDAQGNPIVPIASYNVAANDPRGMGLDPTVQSIIGLTALPNTFEVGDGLNTAGYRFLATRTDPERDFNMRIDHTFNQNNSLFGRFSFGQQDTVGDTGNAGAARFPGLPPIVATFRSPRNLAIGLRSTLSPVTTNELVVGGNRFIFDFAIPTNLDERTTPIDIAQVTDPLSNSFGNKRTITTYQVLDNISHSRGAHTFRAGVNFRMQQHYDVRGSVAALDVNPQQVLGGTVDTTRFGIVTSGANTVNTNDRGTLSNLVNNLLGRLSNANVGLVDTGGQYGAPGTPFTFDAWYPEFDVYFQDDWKIRPNLTLNLGLRWEPKPKPFGRGGSTILVPDRPLTIGSAPASNVSFVEGDLYRSDYNNFGPAIGVAWDPFSDGRTAIRGNFRIAFDRISTFLPSSAIFPNNPGSTVPVIQRFNTTSATDSRLRDNLINLAPPTGVSPDALRTPLNNQTAFREVLDPNFKTPMTYMFSAGIQRDIGRGFVVDMQYIGRAGRNLIGGYDRNQVDIFNNGFLDAFRQAQAGVEHPLLERLTRPLRGTQTTLQYLNSQFSTTLANNNVAGLASTFNTSIVSVGGVQTRLPEAVGLGANFFNDYPQFLGGLRIIDSDSFSNYHGGVFQIGRRFDQGFQLNVSYTFSKSLDDKSFDPTFTRISGGNVQSAQSTPFDPRDRRLTYAVSDFDRTHVLQGSGSFELPFGSGKRFLRNANGFVNRLVGGFTLSTLFVYQSGVPFTVVAGSNTFSNVASSRV